MGARKNLPRPVPRQRPGPAYGLVFLGDPPSFDEDDANPHICVKPQRCSCRAVACGDRGVSCDMGRRPLVRRRWRLGCGVSQPNGKGMPPKLPRPPRSLRQSRLRSRTSSCPVAPRESSERLAKPPHCRVRMSLTAISYGPAHPSIRPRRLPAAWRIRADGVHLPMRSAILAHRNRLAPRRRQPQATAAAPAGFPPGCPVSRSDRDGSRPTAPGRPQTAGNIHLAPKRHQKGMLSSLAATGHDADLAAPSLPKPRSPQRALGRSDGANALPPPTAAPLPAKLKRHQSQRVHWPITLVRWYGSRTDKPRRPLPFAL